MSNEKIEIEVINNMFQIAMKSYYGEDYSESILYANKIIEQSHNIDNIYIIYQAWFFKGMSLLKQSIPYKVNKINPALQCIKTAINIIIEKEDLTDSYFTDHTSFAFDFGMEIEEFATMLSSSDYKDSLNENSDTKIFRDYYTIMKDVVAAMDYCVTILEEYNGFEEITICLKEWLIYRLIDICYVESFYDGSTSLKYFGLTADEKVSYLRMYDEFTADPRIDFDNSHILHRNPIERRGVHEFSRVNDAKINQSVANNKSASAIAT